MGSNPSVPTILAESTTHKGDVAEMLAAAELLRRGYRVSRPLSNGTPYDLIIDDGARLFKVQVKKANEQGDSVRIPLSSSKYHRGRTRVSYSATCDVLIGVDCSTVQFYAFFGDEMIATEIRLRLAPAKNNQTAGIKLATDYELSRIFPMLGKSWAA